MAGDGAEPPKPQAASDVTITTGVIKRRTTAERILTFRFIEVYDLNLSLFDAEIIQPVSPVGSAATYFASIVNSIKFSASHHVSKSRFHPDAKAGSKS